MKRILTAPKHAIVKALAAGFVLAGAAQMVHAAPLDFNCTGAAVTYTVPTTGPYTIVANGAQGGTSGTVAGGKGAQVGSVFSLTAGHVLSIAVGCKGGDSATRAWPSGGGGGSFVYNDTTSTLLLVAGGGAGSYGGKAIAGGVGLSSQAGSGSGGTGNKIDGGGGGGFNGAGATGVFGGGGFPGLQGGVNELFPAFAGSGGFGGGGAGGFFGGGGGGGFTGGYGSQISSTGGTSFAAGTVYLQNDGVRQGNGLVQIAAVNTLPQNLACATSAIAALPTSSLANSAAKSKSTMLGLMNTATTYQASRYWSLSLAAVRSVLVLTDGCAARGAVDTTGNIDLVSNCAAQAPIYVCLKDAEGQLAAQTGK